MSHKLLHKHKQELKKLKTDTEKERKAALKKIKGKKEKKSFVSTFKKIAKKKEDEMLERHHREIEAEAEANDKPNDSTATTSATCSRGLIVTCLDSQRRTKRCF